MSEEKKPKKNLSKEKLRSAIRSESTDFEKYYLWLESHMPPSFFEELSPEKVNLVTHSLMSLHLQNNFSQINFLEGALVLCPDSLEADVKVLQQYELYGIRYYRSFVSNAPLLEDKQKRNLKVTLLLFTEVPEKREEVLSQERKEELLALVKAHNPKVTDKEFQTLVEGMSPRFLRSMTIERITLALDLYFRAKMSDECQYQVRYHEDWKEKETPSMQILLAWKNVPKYRFLLELAQMIVRHNLDLQRVVAAYIDPYSTDSVLILSFALHGSQGKAAWDEAEMPDFLRELACLTLFPNTDIIAKTFVLPKILTGNLGNLLRCMSSFIHQMLLPLDPNLYSAANIEEGFCRHQDLTTQLCELFELKFHPSKENASAFEKAYKGLARLVENLDTGHPIADARRRHIFQQGLYFIESLLKTNFYEEIKTSLGFRLDPKYLEKMPYPYKEKFPELPYGIFFLQGTHFLAFHIRFKDLSRGGLRTILPKKMEQFLFEKNQVFQECYNLAYTQQKKNKDIPEGGAKAVILLEPFEKMEQEILIYQKEMENAEIASEQMEKNLLQFKTSQQKEYLYEAQRSFTLTLLSLINCNEEGRLKSKRILDYHKRPEYLYLGPDENMHNPVIEWIASQSEKLGYKPGKAFITSKPSLGINHKEFGVTSLGVMVYVHEILKYIKIDPEKMGFTVKISGGPDGDVAGNALYQLYKKYPHFAKVVALTDVSGTIFDPEGLILSELALLFKEAKPIRHYPAEKLSEGGFLLDLSTKREQTAYIQQTLCYRKKEGKLVSDWLSGSDMNHLFRFNVHKAPADIFIPAGGRPRTLSQENYLDFLDETQKPTAKAIIEGANLYLTEKARSQLEKLGVLIIKDSSANKGGVICSSLEVLATLILTEEEFLEHKKTLTEEILTIIQRLCLEEAKALLQAHKETDFTLTECSDKLSKKINTYKYEILEYLDPIPLSDSLEDPLVRSLYHYLPPLLRHQYFSRVLEKVPDLHKKAIIACYIASSMVYKKGLLWSPSIVDILPLLSKDFLNK